MVKWSGIGCTACRVTFPDSPESCFFGIMVTEQLVSDRRPVPGDFIEREGKEGQIGDYWVNTSGNRIIRLLLQQIQPETRENLFHLLHREVEDIYRFEILDRMRAGFSVSRLESLLDHLLQGNAKAFADGMEKYLE
ncbi:hypothetical protein [Acidaminococcus fermentans]|uniref:hypothetical protein n=1 Tax=Acidaminococcus fermentans TaxID=905 RepID=UPI0030793B63